MNQVADSFPRQYARTQRLTLGEPRNISVAPDGNIVLFLRSSSGSDSCNCLWSIDPVSGVESLLVDPRELGADLTADLPAEEQARRERLREGGAGITSYVVDEDFTKITFTLGGQLFVAILDTSGTADVTEIHLPHPAFDPRWRPKSNQISYLFDGEIWLTDITGQFLRISPEADENTTWGMAEFVAAEEMNRQRGYWWSPDGTQLATCHVNNSLLRTAWIADPANPESEGRAHLYPFAGTSNSVVSLYLLRPDSSDSLTQIFTTNEMFEYITSVSWRNSTQIVFGLSSRDQRTYEIRNYDTSNKQISMIWQDSDDFWVELANGSPCFTHDDKLVTLCDREGRRCLVVDGKEVTPTTLQVRAIIAADKTGVYVSANEINSPVELHVWRYLDGELAKLTELPGVHSAAVAGGTIVLRTTTLDSSHSLNQVLAGPTLHNFAEQPLVRPNVSLHQVGSKRLQVALVLPENHDGSPLPVLCDPYGGPHAQRVVASQSAYLSSQWFANQGFAVVITDGRGTPARGSSWERAVHHDLAQPVLDDQVEALVELAVTTKVLDLTRVGIRGWSFGGYLAALAVLRRPDIFHAGIAGAPVTEWRLYDTHYTERYLGNPNFDPLPYNKTSLLNDAEKLTRPLLLIHGLADDNVLPAHTLQLSSALLAAGKPHEVLPLSGVSHMTPQEVVAENLLLHQLDFLRRSLNL